MAFGISLSCYNKHYSIKDSEDMKNKITVGVTASKYQNFSEWYTQICSERGANLADTRYGVKGCIVHRPWGFKILRRINEILEKEVEKDGHEPVLFPTLIPEENLKRESQHIEGFIPEVFWVTEGGGKTLEQRLALRPTGETAFYPMYALWIKSYRDLPFKCYQSRVSSFRYEMSTRPFLRGREFMFFETHDVFATHSDALDQIRKDMEMSRKIFWDQFAIPHIFFQRPAWDKFAGAVETYAADTILPDGQRNQMGSTHDLGQGFAKSFNVKFLDKDQKEKFGWQTCWGPGIWRVLAALISIHGDDRGLRLPLAISPVQIVIVPILGNKQQEVQSRILRYIQEIRDICTKEGYICRVDESDHTPGFKFNYWEMKGIPIRIEVGPKEALESSATIAFRVSGRKQNVPKNHLIRFLLESANREQEQLLSEGQEYFNKMVTYATTLQELRKKLNEKKSFVKIPLCSINRAGEVCADIIKKKTNGGSISGVPFDSLEDAISGTKCVVCGKNANHITYVARSF